MIRLQRISTGSCVESLTEKEQTSGTNKTAGSHKNGNIKALWDSNIQCDHEIEARRPDNAAVDEEAKECKIIDVAVFEHSRVRVNEREKIRIWRPEKEPAILWDTKRVVVIPGLMGDPGAAASKDGQMDGENWG